MGEIRGDFSVNHSALTNPQVTQEDLVELSRFAERQWTSSFHYSNEKWEIWIASDWEVHTYDQEIAQHQQQEEP